MKIELYYDRECLFCNYYANYIKIKQKHDLKLFNARDYIDTINGFKKLGFDINNGFIIIINGEKIYQGVDAIIFLNKLAKKKKFLYDNYIFRNFIYPIIKQLRKVVLFIKNKNIKL